MPIPATPAGLVGISSELPSVQYSLPWWASTSCQKSDHYQLRQVDKQCIYATIWKLVSRLFIPWCITDIKNKVIFLQTFGTKWSRQVQDKNFIFFIQNPKNWQDHDLYTFLFGTEAMMCQKNWSGFGMATSRIHPTHFEFHPIPPGRILQFCLELGHV